MVLMPNKNRTVERSHNIIQYILTVNEIGVRNALAEDPHCVNAVHEPSGMNAAMLCIYGRLPDFFDILIEQSGHLLDFSYIDPDGDDLQSIGIGVLNRTLMDKVQHAYERFAPQIINNWPEPY